MTHASADAALPRSAGTPGREAARRLPRLSFGGAPIGNLYAGVPDDDAVDTVRHALRLGVRHFDTAPYYGYGLSETRLGTALAGVPRADYSLSTKVGRLLLDADEGRPAPDDGFAVQGRQAVFDYSRDGILRSVESSLRRLGTDRVEILLLHDIGALTHGARHPAVEQHHAGMEFLAGSNHDLVGGQLARLGNRIPDRPLFVGTDLGPLTQLLEVNADHGREPCAHHGRKRI